MSYSPAHALPHICYSRVNPRVASPEPHAVRQMAGEKQPNLTPSSWQQLVLLELCPGRGLKQRQQQ